MKPLYADPLIPPDESTEAMLRRLSVNMDTLTGLIREAERTGHLYLAGVFAHARDTKAAEARETVASMEKEVVNNQKEIVSLPLAIDKRERCSAADAVWKDGERPKVRPEIFPTEMLLLMDAVAGPERRFLLVGFTLPRIGVTTYTWHPPQRKRVPFALTEGIAPSPLVHASPSDRQSPWTRQRD